MIFAGRDLHLTEGLSKEEKFYFSLRAVSVPVIFLLTALIYLYLNRIAAAFIPPLIPLIMRLIKKRYQKRFKPEPVAEEMAEGDALIRWLK